MTKRLFAFVLIMALSVLACGGKREPAGPVRVAAPFSVSSIPILELDGAEVAGRRISVSVFQDHSLVLAEFLKGDVDVLMTGFTQGAAAFAANPEVRLLATPVWGVSSLMVADKTITNLAGLAGKKLMTPFAKSPLDLQTRAILKAAGLEGKVSIVFGPPQQAAALLLAGKTDAIAVPEPIPSQLAASGKAFRLGRYQDLWAQASGGEPRSPQVSLFVKKSFADANRGFVSALVKAAADATAAATAGELAGPFKLDPGIVREGLANTLFALPGRGETIRLSAEFCKRIGLEAVEPKFFYEY